MAEDDTHEIDPYTDIKRADAEAEAAERQDREYEHLKPVQTLLRDDTRQVSTIIRNLTLGGMAFAWLFRYPVPNGNGWVIPSGIAAAMVFFVVSVILDLCQYLFGAHDLYRLFEHWEANRGYTWETVGRFNRNARQSQWFYFGKVAFALFGLVTLLLSVISMTAIG